MRGPITIVGLGPGDPAARTSAVQEALAAAPRIILRTAIHPGIADLVADRRTVSCDDLYERLPNFAAVYAAIAERVLAAATAGPVVYAVPGHPDFGEATVPLIRQGAVEQRIAVATLAAVSALDAIAAALGVDLLASQAQLLDATALQVILDAEPFAAGLLGINPTRPCLIGQVYSADIAAAVKLALGRLYQDDHPVWLVTAAGVRGEERRIACPLHALDRQAVDHLTSLWVPPLAELDAPRAAATLARVIARLRAPGGCPWDREQTHASLRDQLIEETYETIDAIDAGDMENLAEELGDLLTHVYMHAQIAEEAGDFAIEDVFAGVTQKLIRRHPHVFGDARAATSAEVLRTWQAVKSAERRAKGEKAPAPDPLDRLPRSMPVLDRAVRVLQLEHAPGAAPLTAGGATPDTTALGNDLLGSVAAIVATGADPETLLLAALRRRSSAAGATGAPPRQPEEILRP